MSLIAHVDMDAFFAAVEQSKDRSLKGKPVIVGADPQQGRGRGVVAAASYEARRYGIHSAMSIGRAYRQCRHGIFLKPDFALYSEVSQRVMALLESFSYLIEPVSIDEAYLDLTGLSSEPLKLAQQIQAAIESETGCGASIGMAGNKSVAKIASAMNKPKGITICPPGKEREFIAPLAVEKLPGVGQKTRHILSQLGVQSIGDLADAPKWMISNRLGSHGLKMQKMASGEDYRSIELNLSRKSVSVEKTFRQDSSSMPVLKQAMLDLAERLAVRLTERKMKGATVTIKIRYENFETLTRQKTLPVAIGSAENLGKISLELLNENLHKKRQVRLLGLGVSSLEEDEIKPQLSLFREEFL